VAVVGAVAGASVVCGAAVGVVAATGAVAASRHPVIKAAINQGIEKVKQQIQQWKSSSPSEGPKSS